MHAVTPLDLSVSHSSGSLMPCMDRWPGEATSFPAPELHAPCAGPREASHSSAGPGDAACGAALHGGRAGGGRRGRAAALRGGPAEGPGRAGRASRPLLLLLLGRLLRPLPPPSFPLFPLPPRRRPQGEPLPSAAVRSPTPSPRGERRQQQLAVLCVRRRACKWRRGGAGGEAAGVQRCGSGSARRPGGPFPPRRGLPAHPCPLAGSGARPGPAGCPRGRAGRWRAGAGAGRCVPLLSWCLSCPRRLARVTVLHDRLGCRTFELPPSAAVGDVKARIDAEAGFPRAEQRLWHRGREVRGRGGRRHLRSLVAAHTAVVLEVPTRQLFGSCPVFWCAGSRGSACP